MGYVTRQVGPDEARSRRVRFGKLFSTLLGSLLAALGVLVMIAASPAERAPADFTIALDPVNWTPIGPAPTVTGPLSGCTTYTEPASGRISALAAHPTDPNTVYIAAAGGGVWRTMNAQEPVPENIIWTPLTDTQSTLFMGAIALAPSSPDVIYAGTGEASFGPSKANNFRYNIYYGRGILRGILGPDGGTMWTPRGSTEFERLTISKIVVHPTDPNTVYVAVGAVAANGLPGNTKKGIWKSTDGGVNWTNTTLGFISTTAAFSDLVMDPDPSNPDTLYAAVGEPGGSVANGVYKTTNGGTVWSRAGDFPGGEANGRIKLAIAASAPQTLYASIAASGKGDSVGLDGRMYRMLKTTTGGTTWTDLDFLPPRNICISGHTSAPACTELRTNYMGQAGDYHSTLAVDPLNPDVVYAGGICLVMTTDGGRSAGNWVAIAQGDTDGPHRDHHGIGFDANMKLLDGNDGGIWRLDDPDLASWTNLNGNLQITQFIGIALHPTNPNVAYGGTQDTGTVKFEGLREWTRLLRGDGGLSAVSVSATNRVYQITRISSAGPIFRRSDDDGTTWAAKDTGIDRTDPMNFYPPFVMDPSNSNRLLLGTNRVYETVTGGDRDPPVTGDGWRALSTPGVSGWSVNDRIDSLAIAAVGGNTIYAATGGDFDRSVAHVFVTFDRGANWQQRNVPGAADHFHQLLVDPTDTTGMTVYAARDRFDGGHVFRTTNGSATWTDISGDLPNLPVNAIVVNSTTLYVGTDNGVYASRDQGVHWSRFGVGLPNAQVVDLKLNTTLNILAAATHGRGVWEILVGP